MIQRRFDSSDKIGDIVAVFPGASNVEDSFHVIKHPVKLFVSLQNSVSLNGYRSSSNNQILSLL